MAGFVEYEPWYVSYSSSFFSVVRSDLCHFDVASIVARWLTLLIVAAPAILSMYILDRNVFTYRHLISDDTLASVVVVCFFFFTVSFVFFSLTFEATAEFFQASQILIQRVTDSIEEDEVTREQWTGMVTSLQSQ